jgi:hypothetical protein
MLFLTEWQASFHATPCFWIGILIRSRAHDLRSRELWVNGDGRN